MPRIILQSIRMPIAYYINEYFAILFYFVWPPTLLQQLKQMVGSFKTRKRYSEGVPNVASFKQKINYRLPFDGEWYVFRGGINQLVSHSWHLLEQRYAYDFVIYDQNQRSYKNLALNIMDFYSYGQEILAPADGLVVELQNNRFDCVVPFFTKLFTRDLRGNYIVIKHTDDEFSLLAHLKKGSICVKVGDHVKVGQKIAECGNSGSATEPVLHFQIQDRQDMFSSMSLPVKFDNFYLVDDEEIEFFDKGYITRGQKISHKSY